ncbi:4Fe-4S binding protein [Cuniculiplasma sp. SKW3]|uniref:4Fe-4S binding protein n=1 Tax=Cuniculiplasma sp. SKW3 TaxID=3400170 RepID=UPI003FD67679
MSSETVNLILYFLAALMGIFTSWIIVYARNADNQIKKIISYIFLSMMNGMLLGPAVYLSGYLPFNIEDVILLSSAIMGIELIYPMIEFVKTLEGSSSRGVNLGIYVIFTIFDEFLMSLDFISIVSGRSFIAFYGGNVLNVVFYPLTSYWFIFPMSLEMLLTAIFSLRDETRIGLVFITFQSAVMFLTPSAIINGLWEGLAVYLGGSIMTALFILLFEYLYRKEYAEKNFSAYLNRIIFTYFLMMLGVMLYQLYGNLIVLGISIVIEMTLYLSAVLRKNYFEGHGKVYWLADRKWSTMFLLNIFLAEFAMGATFDFQYYGASSFIGSLGLAPFTLSPTILLAFLFNSVVFIGGVTGSPWFLIMMGAEMGSLVVLKIMKTKNPENRVRMALMIMAYGVYSILLPSFVLANPQDYPFIGWSMGIGTGGGLAAALIIPMLLTYLISGILSLLFGARQLCSVFCTAPLMYQGTFYDSMKKFNRQGNLAKKITIPAERENKIYRGVSLTVYASLGIASVISLMDNFGYLNLTMYGSDPLVFIYIFLFDIIWYAVFITMPYFGSYGCINTGYCHWGNFNRWIGKFGFFKLKVKNSNQCIECKTKDCATACPVGLSSQPGSFIKGGEFKNSRCVGIGDCVEACPYDNIFFYDVRHFIRGRIGKGKRTEVKLIEKGKRN